MNGGETLLVDLASFTRASTLTLTGDGEPEPVEAEVVSTVYFRTLAIRPLFGSTLSTGEADGSLARAEVVVGHDLWRRRFGGERGIVGRRVTINGLVILSETPLIWNPEHTNPSGGLAEYYRRNVIGGPGAFVMVAENFASFGAALVKKLVAEIAEPGSVAAPREARARP